MGILHTQRFVHSGRPGKGLFGEIAGVITAGVVWIVGGSALVSWATESGVIGSDLAFASVAVFLAPLLAASALLGFLARSLRYGFAVFATNAALGAVFAFIVAGENFGWFTDLTPTLPGRP